MLGPRALNRALLARQMLLGHDRMPALARIASHGGRATLEIGPFAPILAAELSAVSDEGMRLLGFTAPGMEGRIVVRAPTS